MKKLLSLIALLCFVTSAFATGQMPINSPLTGTVNFTNGGPQAITNVFEPPFTYAPAFNSYLNSANTNALPLTNTVTATNFIIQIASNAGAGTNATVYWTANPISTVLQYGSFGPGDLTGSTTWTNTFSPPYASTPVVVATGSALAGATNNYVAITSVSTTAFIVTSGNTNQVIYWQAVGPAYARVQSGPSGTDGLVTH